MEEITDDTFRQLLSDFSDWYDQRECINVLKVLYRDLFENKFNLDKATTVMDLINSLIDFGDLDSKDLRLLYDTINITKQYGLEKKIKSNLLPSFPNVKGMIISKFTHHRQKIMKLGMVLIDEEVKKISGLYNKPVKEYADTWSLIMDLEHNRIICDGKMDAFIEKLSALKLQQAVEVFKEDIANPSLNPGQISGVKLILKRKREDSQPHPEYILDLLKELNECKDFLTLRHKRKCFAILRNIVSYYKCHGLDLDQIEEGSIIFHLSTHDLNALMSLWEIHSSGKLIKDLAGILVPEKHQQEFLDEWKTCIDENEYKAAISKLKGKAPTAKMSFELKAGDLVQVKRRDALPFSHWGVYIGNDQVIHLARAEFVLKDKSSAIVQQVSWKEFLVGSDEWDYVPCPSNIDREEVVRCAKSAKGGYFRNLPSYLISYNCEHFARWCHSEAESKQLPTAAKWALTAVAVTAGTIAAGVVAAGAVAAGAIASGAVASGAVIAAGAVAAGAVAAGAVASGAVASGAVASGAVAAGAVAAGAGAAGAVAAGAAAAFAVPVGAVPAGAVAAGAFAAGAVAAGAVAAGAAAAGAVAAAAAALGAVAADVVVAYVVATGTGATGQGAAGAIPARAVAARAVVLGTVAAVVIFASGFFGGIVATAADAAGAAAAGSAAVVAAAAVAGAAGAAAAGTDAAGAVTAGAVTAGTVAACSVAAGAGAADAVVAGGFAAGAVVAVGGTIIRPKKKNYVGITRPTLK